MMPCYWGSLLSVINQIDQRGADCQSYTLEVFPVAGSQC